MKHSFLVIALFAFLLPLSSASATPKNVKRVLIFNVFEPLASPGVGLLDQSIVTALKNSPYQIELYSENLEAILFPDEDSQRQIRNWYIHKYSRRKPDVIIAVGPAPLMFMLESHEKAFPGVPIVFCGSTEEMLHELKPDSHFTGTWGVVQPEKTLIAALNLQPSTKHVVVVGGVGAYDRELESIVRASFRNYESKLDFTYLTDLDMPTLLERLRHLPSDTIVYHTAITEDAAGTHFIDAPQSIPMVVGAANAPVFVIDDVDIGRGTVGGYVLSLATEGQTVAAMVVRILNGEKPENIPIEKSANIYMFDWRAMRRWGFKTNNLPAGSVLLYRQPTFWELYQGYIIVGISLILIEGLLILGLLWQRTRRRKVERELAVSNDRLRMSVEAGKSVGWEWDFKTGKNERFGDLRTLFGIPSDTYSGRIDDFRSWVHPSDQDHVWKTIMDARQNRESYTAEFRVVRPDGSTRWIESKGRFYYAKSGDAERMLGMAADITDRKTIEHALNNLSGRLIEAQEEERRRIAREIHDDYNQRVAVLAIDLESLAENVSNLNGNMRHRLHKLWNTVSELGADLHALSHSLHSSTLESLGLVAGISTFLEEFREQQGMQVEFTHENIPHGIPADVALCLFRIVQESIRNIKRHSGTNHAEVRLEGSGEKLHLSVLDHGKGFDPAEHSTHGGIGIRSMEERLRLLGGQLKIRSRPNEGTRIDAWLPLAIARQSKPHL